MRSVLFAALFAVASGQQVSVPSTCTEGFEAGSDEVIFHLPYTYNQVLSVISSFGDLTWSGNPPNTISLNGTDNKVGTARSYKLQGSIDTVETLTQYSIPPCPGPYREIHNTALVDYSAVNVKAYFMYDGNEVTSDCLGKSAVLNMTTHFCATNATLAAGLLHTVHMQDAVNVGKMLGGKNFTSCNALYSDFSAWVCPFGLPVLPKKRVS